MLFRSKRFNYQSRVVLISTEHLHRIITSAPETFGAEPEEYKYNVFFLKEPLTAEKAIESIRTKEGIDRIYAGDGVLYLSQLKSRASQSELTKIIGTPIYKEITIRNWNTTTKLLER